MLVRAEISLLLPFFPSRRPFVVCMTICKKCIISGFSGWHFEEVMHDDKCRQDSSTLIRWKSNQLNGHSIAMYRLCNVCFCCACFRYFYVPYAQFVIESTSNWQARSHSGKWVSVWKNYGPNFLTRNVHVFTWDMDKWVRIRTADGCLFSKRSIAILHQTSSPLHGSHSVCNKHTTYDMDIFRLIL